MANQKIGYFPMLLLLLMAVAVGVFVHQRASNIQQALAAEIFQQEREIATLESNFVELTGLVKLGAHGREPNLQRLGKRINDIRLEVRKILNGQNQYTFSALDGAVEASARVSPVLDDLGRWMTQGLPSGYGPMTPPVLRVMELRSEETVDALKEVHMRATQQAETLLARQSAQLGKFKRYINLFLSCLIVVSCGLGVFVLMQRDRQARLARDRQRTIDAISAVDDGFIQLDANDKVLVHNLASETLCPSLVEHLQQVECGLLEALLRSVQSGGIQISSNNIDGSSTEMPSTVEVLTPEKRFIRISQRSTDDGGQVILLTEITDFKNTQQQLEEQASTDVLTRLPNRSLFHDRLFRLIQYARQGEYRLAIMLIDLDHFKEINDRLGHAAGDELLREMARRIRASINADEGDIGARMGGDEFAAILARVDKPYKATEIGEQLLHNLRVPMELNGHEVMMSASIGIALWPEHTEATLDMKAIQGANFADQEISMLLNCADAACYQAKSRGRNRVETYNWQLRTELKDRTQLELQLHRAVENNELRVTYQPQWNMATGEICALEALLEWRRENGDLIAPEVFIPVAEQTGCIDRIGHMVLETACRDAQSLLAEKLLPQSVKICVNITPRQFVLQDVPAMVEEILAQSGIAPTALVLEITEGTFKGNSQKVAKQLKILGESGVSLVVDGFGVGYSSLLRLLELPLDGLKIDQSFIRDLPVTDIHNQLELSDPTKNAALEITKTIIAMARSLKLEVIAVGVNSRDQAQLLRKNQCMIIQGNYFCKPLAFDDLKPYLRERKRPRVAHIREIPTHGRFRRKPQSGGSSDSA